MPVTRRLSDSDADLDAAALLLKRGGTVAMPTETVYGLAARGLDETCVRAIFAAKGRPADNPVILHVASLQDALPLWSDDDVALSRARLLAQAFWPGPLTIVCGKSALVPDVVTAGLGKVAVRAPAHPAAIALLLRVGEPLAAPSANASTRPSPTSAADVLASLDGRIDAVIDGGACRYGIESTVVDVSGPSPRLLRPGAITYSELLAFVPDLQTRAAGSAAHATDASPGLRHKHYAPAIAAVSLVENVDAVWGGDAAILCRTSDARGRPPRAAPLELLDDDPVGYARGLYAALYRLERLGPATLCIAAVPAEPMWDAVRDRLLRASA